ncbi:hypothetical protein CEUSTIGMA_g6072.t1 [Chlamydomonas eustigma]|uniref:Uncharacterized protein n=1 Tax=Chlamydomonas eustigma TaxID=1157962 RepID=A0A250X6C2_9CHLO|nr:hypothetical protein CEUSTIGMA_g6072.t1 [Chlamydomonas eustigma]|eukprot:GAX78634.1 hypothetical protein CEUSTIGMA_g6072.t1 [Chlamydomonas eustigma]
MCDHQVRQGSDLSDLSGPDDQYQKYGGDTESEEEEEEDTAAGYEEEIAEAADWTPEQIAAGAAVGQQQQQEAEEMLRKAAVDAITAQSGGAVASGGAAMPLALAAAKAREARQSYVAAGVHGGGSGAFSPSALQATGMTGAFSPNAAARAGGGGGALSPSGARYQTGSRDNAVAVSPTASRRVDAGPGVFGSTYEQSSRTSAIMTASQPALQPGTTTTASSLPRAPEVTIPSDSSSPIVGKVASSFQQPVGSATSSELTDDAIRSPGNKQTRYNRREEDHASEDANPELIHSTCSSWSSPRPGHYDSNATSPTAAAATADIASASDSVSVKPSDLKPSFLETVARSNELMDSATSKEAVRQQLQQAVQLNNETVPLQSTEERAPHPRSPTVSFEPSRTSALPVDQHTPHHVKAFPADTTPVVTPEDRLLSAATDSAAAAAATFKASTELPNNTSSSSSNSLKRTGSMQQAASSSGIPASLAAASTPSSGSRGIIDEVELFRRSTSSLPSYMRTTASSGSKAAPSSTHSATPPARVSAESGRGSRRSSECGEGGDCKTIPVNNSSSKPKAGMQPLPGASSRTIPSKSPEPPSGSSFSRPGSSSTSKPPSVPLPSSRSSRDMSSSASKLSAAVAAAGPSASLKANYSASSNKALGSVPTTQSTMISAQDNVQATNVPAAAAASSDLRRSTSLNKGQAISNAATSGSRSAQSGTTQPSSTAATSLGATTTAAPIINNTGTSDAAGGASNTDAAAAPAPEAATAVPAADAGSSSDTKLSPRSSANTPSAAASPARAGAAGLPFGSFRLVRLKKAVNCDASAGTTEQETHDGLKEVFQCDVTLQPGSLAVIVAHDVDAEGAADSTRVPRTWVFCPDPLCLDSKPQGSSLPSWPKKLPLEGGMKIVRSEYNKLLEVGLDIQAPQKQQTKSSPARTTSTAATVNSVADDDNKQEPAVLSSTHALASGTAMDT